MKKVWSNLGKISFWLNWPLLFIYLRISIRTRIAVIVDDEVLAVRGWLSNGKWSLPGGGLHHNELPEAGILRELREETGLIIKPDKLKYLGLSPAKSNGFKFRYHSFSAVLDHKPKTEPQNMEIVEIDWIKLDRISIKNAEDTMIFTLDRWKETG